MQFLPLRAPSNCNTQPWFVHVVTGDKLEQLRETLPAAFAVGDVAPDFPYDGATRVSTKIDNMVLPRRFMVLKIPREEKAKRQNSLWAISGFDAPAVAFFMLPDGFGLREAWIWGCSPKPSCWA